MPPNENIQNLLHPFQKVLYYYYLEFLVEILKDTKML